MYYTTGMHITTIFKYLQKTSVLLSLFWISMIVLTSSAVLALTSNERSYKGVVNEVWLPPYNDEIWFDGMKSAVESAETVKDKYGQAVIFHSTEDMDFQIYVTNKSRRLDISQCPDVFKVKSDGASCSKLGNTPESAIYGLTPSYASGSGVGYIERGTVFIAFYTGGDSSTTNVVSDARSFRKISNNQIDALLARNKASVEKHNAVVRQKNAHQKKLESEAYLSLPFTPYLPTSLPTDWKRAYLQIIATDPKNPQFLEATYLDKAEWDGVKLWVGKLSNFKLGATCGPTPGAGGAHLPCTWNSSNNYYIGMNYGDGFTQRYVYKSLGDSIAILETSTYYEGEIQPIPATTLAAQELLLQSLQQIDPSQLKNAEYYDMFYY